MARKQYSIEDNIPEFKIFKDRAVLSDSYIPEEILFRPEQMKELGYIYSAPFRNDKPRNVFCSGMPGTGKTLAARYWFVDCMRYMAEQKRNDIAFGYVNFAAEQDLVRALYSLCIQYDKDFKIKSRGLAPSEYIANLCKRAAKDNKYLFLIFDEVDQLYKKQEKKDGDDANSVIVSFLRADTLFGAKNVSLNMITNDTQLESRFTPAVVSSLSARKLFFPRYNAEQLSAILRERAEKAFDAVDVTSGAISLIASLVASESGDARKALQLLEHSAEIVEHKARREILDTDVREAYELSETKMIEQQLPSLPKHYQLTYLAVVLNETKARKDDGNTELHVFTLATLYNTYCSLTKQANSDAVSDRTFQDIINDLSTSGLVSTDMRYGGRGKGRARVVSLTSSFEAIKNTLAKLNNMGKLQWEELKLV